MTWPLPVPAAEVDASIGRNFFQRCDPALERLDVGVAWRVGRALGSELGFQRCQLLWPIEPRAIPGIEARFAHRNDLCIEGREPPLEPA